MVAYVVCVTLRTGISSCPGLKTARLQSPATRDRENQVGELLSKQEPKHTQSNTGERKDLVKCAQTDI